MDFRIQEILITENQINEATKKAAKWVDENYKNKNLVLLGLLKGCVPFFGRIMTEITVDFETDFMTVSSFKGKTVASTVPEIISDLTIDIENKDVLIIEDIVDSALTLFEVKKYLYSKKAKSVAILTLLNKQAGRKIDLNPEYKCFEVENKFLVGFGLDYEEKLRNLPYVGVFKTNNDK